jgi:hypothetical protein
MKRSRCNIIAVAAFVSAIIYGTFLAYKEIEKATSSLTPAEFKEHTQKAARHAEQATSDAIMGLIAKYFAKIIETNKPLIGPQNENAGPGMGPDKSKLPIIVEEKKPVMAEENVKNPIEETTKKTEKPKEKDKFDKEKSEENPIYRGGKRFEMSDSDIRNSVDKTTGLMKEKGRSLKLDKNNKFIQEYGGAFEVDISTIPKELKITYKKGTHYEITPQKAGTMILETYQNLLKQIEVEPFNKIP